MTQMIYAWKRYVLRKREVTIGGKICDKSGDLTFGDGHMTVLFCAL